MGKISFTGSSGIAFQRKRVALPERRERKRIYVYQRNARKA